MWPLQVRMVALLLMPLLLLVDWPWKEEEVGEELMLLLLLLLLQTLSRPSHHFPMRLLRGKIEEP